MIIDLHTRIWDHADALGESVASTLRRRRLEPWSATTATAEAHAEAMKPVACAAVLGFESGLLEAHLTAESVAEAIKAQENPCVGFVGIDPTLGRAVPRLEDALELGMVGVTVSPSAAGFHPADTRAMALFEACEDRGLPVIVESAASLSPKCNMEFAQPYLLDEVARAFPKLKLVIGSFGLPWIDQGVTLLSKHPSVYADVSGLVTKSWQLYNALVNAYQSGVMNQVLFGSGFPFCEPEKAIVTLYSVNTISQGTPLPSVPREQLRSVVERDTLKELGIAKPFDQDEDTGEPTAEFERVTLPTEEEESA
jgi:predicted TIM-barrel fold metal-dependent hydrolase